MRVDTPQTYISANAAVNARSLRTPRLQDLRVEIAVSRLWHFQPQIAHACVQRLVLEAIGMTATPLGALVRSRTQELAALYAVSAANNQALSEAEVLDGALRRVSEVLRIESGRIFLFDEQTGQFSLTAERLRQAPRTVGVP